MPFYLSIDCGSTQIKAAVVDHMGKIRSLAAAPTPLRGDEIDAAALAARLFDVVSAAREAAGLPVDRICATGFGNGLCALRKDGTARLLSSMARSPVFPSPRLERLTAQTVWGGQPLSLLRRIRQESPEEYREIRQICFCKDYLIYLLSGSLGTDYTDASAGALLDAERCAYSEEILSLQELSDAKDLLPPLRYGTRSCASLSREAAQKTGLREGTPLCGGLFDVCACLLGDGGTEQDYHLIAGTWGINAAVADRLSRAAGITQTCLYLTPGRYLMIDSAPTSCVNLDYILEKDFPRLSHEEAFRLAEAQPHDPDLLYLPYRYAPMDLPAATSRFLGRAENQSAGGRIRCVMEGVAMEHRRRVEKLQKAGQRREKAVLSGGAARSGFWCQMFADVLGLPIEQSAQSQTGLLGCAMVCAQANGEYADLPAAAKAMAEPGRIFFPQTDQYEKTYQRMIKEIAPWTTGSQGKES